MTKVYVVTSGEYSGQSVEGVFSTREAAEAFAAEVDKTNESGFVDECILDARAGERARPQWYTVIGCKSGAASSRVHHQLYPHTFEDAKVDKAEPWSSYFRSLPEFAHLVEGEPFILARSGISAEHALNLAATARREWLRSRAVAGAEGARR